MKNSYGNYISGEWVDGADWSERRNPSDLDEVIGHYAIARDVDLEHAVAAAQDAQSGWRDVSPEQRATTLDMIADAIREQIEPMAVLLSREEGKTLPEARGEISFSASIFKYFAGEASRLSGVAGRSTRLGVDVEVLREPIGVVGMITPWNFPFLMPAWKIAPALAYGNSVILKPSEFTNGSACNLAAIIDGSDLPKGVFQLLMGDGPQLGAQLAAHTGLDAMSFTGSVMTGRKIASKFSPHKHLQMEMGGKNPLIVMEDANLDAAVDAALRGAFHASGQRCTASSKLIVHHAVFHRFVALLGERVGALRVGHALEADVDLGPVVNDVQHQRVLGYVEAAKRDGATLAASGLPLTAKTRGHFVTPALFTDAPADSALNQEEIFGPVASVIPVANFEDAMACANDTEYGLSASIYTTSLKYAVEFKHRSNAGMVQINLPTFGGDYHVPFGGFGSSGAGPKELGDGAREFYTRSKSAYTAT